MRNLAVTITVFILSLYFIPAFAQLGTITFDIQKDKPQKFKNKTLKSEKTGEKKFTVTKRIMQNTVTHYNYHFNANNRINQVLERARIANKDNYNRLLPFYGYSLAATSAQKTELDSAIYKATAGILLHDLRNDWVDNLYLIIGKAYYYQKEFDSASMTFQFINYNLFPRKKKDESQLIVGANVNASGNNISIANKETPSLLSKTFTVPPSRNDALIWQIRTLIELEDYSESAGLINTLKYDKNFPTRLRSDLEEVNAYWFYKQRMYDSAAAHLEKALAAADDKQDKARREFLLAQLFENTRQLKKASEYYSKAIKHTTDPLMDIYANLNNAKMYSTDDEKTVDNSIASLLKMAKRDKYDTYRDIVYYAAGELALEKNDTTSAAFLFNKSLFYNVLNSDYKNLAYLQLADIAFAKRNYRLASALYDSLDINDDILLERSKEIQALKKSLTKIVEKINIIDREDSLQSIAQMPLAEREAYIKKLLKNIRKQQGLKDDAINIINTSNIFSSTKNESSDIFTTNDKGEWYFYNSSIKAKGFNEFLSRWGQRSNVDNWRRKAANEVNVNYISPITDVASTLLAKDSALNAGFNNEYSYDVMVDNLPSTAEKLTASNALVASSLFDLGKIYQNELEDYRMAVTMYETSLQRFPEKLYEGELYLNLYYCYKKLGNLAKANQYKNLLTGKFANTRFAQFITNPNAIRQGVADPVVTKKYENIYNLFIEGNFDKALKEKKIADSLYTKNYWSPQLLYIEAVYYVKQKKDSQAINTLQNIINLYPNSLLQSKATTMIDVLQRRSEIEGYLTALNVTRSKEDSLRLLNDKPADKKPALVINVPPIPKPDTTTKAKVITPAPVVVKPLVSGSFSLIENVPHYVIMILDKVDPVYMSEARNAFSRYNREKFAGQAIDITRDAFDKDRNFLIFTQFADANAALAYADKLKRNAPSEVSWLPAAKYSFTIISDANLQVLKANKDLTAYIKLLNTKYPGRF